MKDAWRGPSVPLVVDPDAGTAEPHSGAAEPAAVPAEVVGARFGTLARAEEAEAAAEELAPLDAVVVVRGDGRIELRQTRERSVGERAIAGGTVGLLAGLLLGAPVGLALGGLVIGGAWGARDTGIANGRLRRLGRRLNTGEAILCVLVEAGDAARARELLAAYGGEAVDPGPPDP